MPSSYENQWSDFTEVLMLTTMALMVTDSSDSSDSSDSDDGLALPTSLPNLGPTLPRLTSPLETFDAPFEEFELFDSNNGMEFDEFPPFDNDLDEGNEFLPFDEDPADRSLFIPPVYSSHHHARDTDDDESVDEDDEAADELMSALLNTVVKEMEEMEAMEAMRATKATKATKATRGSYSQTSKYMDGYEELRSWPSSHFENVFGMSSRTFWEIASILQENPIFQSKGNKPQRPVSVQLACLLFRLGRNGSTARDASLVLSLGDGTVSLYCKRVARALREFILEHVVCPAEEVEIEIEAILQESSNFLE